MKVGVQLYSIKTISESEGLKAALKKANELGYDCVEFAGYFGLSAREVTEELKKNNVIWKKQSKTCKCRRKK